MQVLSLGIPSAAIMPAFGAIILISVVVSGLADMVMPTPGAPPVPHVLMAVLLGVIFLSFAFGIWKVGSFFGGKGTFQEAMIVSIFFQAVLLPFQVLQILIAFAVPGLAGLYGIGLLIYGVWINVNFIDALHGIASFGKSLGILFLASVFAAIMLVIAASMLGQSVVVPA